MPRTCIKPVLANGELRCIGSTTVPANTAESLRRIMRSARRFQKIDVTEPSVDRDHRHPAGAQSAKFEEHHGVKYTDESLQRGS